jgi:hypothetical protein
MASHWQDEDFMTFTTLEIVLLVSVGVLFGLNLLHIRLLDEKVTLSRHLVMLIHHIADKKATVRRNRTGDVVIEPTNSKDKSNVESIQA